jgi:TRAP-type C4-dicarboxylate transport system substrate-binding protein
VYPALRTRRIDAFPGTAIAAVAFQWFTKAAFVTKEPRGIVIGAMVLKKERFDALPPEHRTLLLETAGEAHSALARAIRRDDERAFEAILGRGVEAVSLAAHEAEWLALLRKARQSLVGKLYTAEQLKRVEDAAAAAD